jgi:hypothetical protein
MVAFYMHHQVLLQSSFLSFIHKFVQIIYHTEVFLLQLDRSLHLTPEAVELISTLIYS